jgi:hypothetical protein
LKKSTLQTEPALSKAPSDASSSSAASSLFSHFSASNEFGQVIQSSHPITTLVLHYDQNQHSVCEAISLVRPNEEFVDAVNSEREQQNVPPIPLSRFPKVHHTQMIVLVSPSFYHQRKRFYRDYCQVQPLLFSWKTLTAHQLKVLMRLNDSDQQLYVSTMLDMLRRMQRQGSIPPFPTFRAMVEQACQIGTQGMMDSMFVYYIFCLDSHHFK